MFGRNSVTNHSKFSPNVIVTLQTVQLRNWFHAGAADTLADIPNLDATLAAGVDVLGRIRDRNGADHLAVCQGINLTCVTRDTRSCQSIQGEWYGLQLALAVHMIGICPVAK